MYPSRVVGYGSGRGGELQGANILHYCTHALYDFRRSHHRDTGGSDTTCFLSGGPKNGAAWGDGSSNNFYGDSLGAFAAVSSAHRLNIVNNILDAQSEVFCIARIKIQVGGWANVCCRGRDGSGAGWSIDGSHDVAGGHMNVVTTSGGDALRSAPYSKVFEHNSWHTVHYAYKSGAYVRSGDSGIWRAETTFAATGLRGSTVGLGINRVNSFNATSNFFLRFWGMGTSVPNDSALESMHLELLASERAYEVPGSALMSSVGASGGSLLYHADPVAIF